MASRGYQEPEWDEPAAPSQGASRADSSAQPFAHAARSAEPTPPPVPKPIVFTQPSSNVAALLRSRAMKDNPQAAPVPPVPPAEPVAPVAPVQPAEPVQMAEPVQPVAPVPPAAEPAPQRASRAAVSDEPASNISALFRSQAAPVAVAPVTASRAAAPEEDAQYDVFEEQPEEYTAVLDEGDGETPQPPVKRKRRASDILLLVLAILLIAGGATYGIYATVHSSLQQTKVDMAGNHVVPDDTSMFDPSTLEAMDANDDIGQRFIIDAVSLDVPLGEVNEVNNVINPPGFSSAYQIRNRGVSLDKADTGTVYVAAHSLRKPGRAPGNYVIDIDTGVITVPDGATIQVGPRTYVMTSSEIIAKTDLGADSKIWADTPGMLVFITCLQYNDASKYKDTGGHSPTNAVIIGQLVS